MGRHLDVELEPAGAPRPPWAPRRRRRRDHGHRTRHGLLLGGVGVAPGSPSRSARRRGQRRLDGRERSSVGARLRKARDSSRRRRQSRYRSDASSSRRRGRRRRARRARPPPPAPARRSTARARAAARGCRDDRPLAQQDALQLGPEGPGHAVAQAEPDRRDGRPQLPLGLGHPQRLAPSRRRPRPCGASGPAARWAAHAASSGVGGRIDQREVHALGQVDLGQPRVVEHRERRHPAGQGEPGRHRPGVAAGAAEHGHLEPETARLQRRDQGLAAPGHVGHHRHDPAVGARQGRQRSDSAAPSPRRSRTPAAGPGRRRRGDGGLLRRLDEGAQVRRRRAGRGSARRRPGRTARPAAGGG